LSTEEADRIHVIRLGEDFESPKSIENEQDRFRDLSGILLSVGTIEIRKNQISLLNAYRILAKRHPGRFQKIVLGGG
jgi:hypothetical protein